MKARTIERDHSGCDECTALMYTQWMPTLVEVSIGDAVVARLCPRHAEKLATELNGASK